MDQEQACLAGSSVDSLIPASRRTTYVSEVISAQDSGLGRILGGPVKLMIFSCFLHYFGLLPTGSEERGALGAGSILVAILPSCQDNYEKK